MHVIKTSIINNFNILKIYNLEKLNICTGAKAMDFQKI